MVSLAPLPVEAGQFMHWSWSDFEPYYQELQGRDLSPATIEAFLTDWSALSERVVETWRRLYVATACDTVDTEAEHAYHRFLDEIFPRTEQAEQSVKEKVLASGLTVPGFEVPLQKMRAEVALFREENIPLLQQERKLEERYNKLVGAQTVQWRGEEIPIPQLEPSFQDTDRATREEAWRLARTRQLRDRPALGDLWREYLELRCRLAANAGFDDYRQYRWQQMLRFDYTPQDCLRFHEAIAEVVVPAATRLLDQRRQELGVDSIRPWDISVDPRGRPPLRPFTDVSQLVEGTSTIFQRVDPQLGSYFQTMRDENLLDLDSRTNKGPGGFCNEYPVIRRPFIFMNAVGMHDDVQTLLHEGGHAFHSFEAGGLPWLQQREGEVGMEFAEVASMAMELLASPYLADPEAGFYSAAEAATALVEHLQSIILVWPYIAVVDAFQHWVYTHPDDAADPENCDRIWAETYRRFIPGEDWSGLEDELRTGWQRKLHIFTDPFYYVEYGLALLGAVQVWGNARRDQAGAVARYRQALALGGTRSIPELYAAAGARFSFEPEPLREAIQLVETVIGELEAQA
jgi:oligoendopeptidase F